MVVLRIVPFLHGGNGVWKCWFFKRGENPKYPE